ncbi:MAG: phytanoyl-CoA dioxygenase family protein [Gammaproteobacteria bacterium]
MMPSEVAEAALRPWLQKRSFAQCYEQFNAEGYILFESVIDRERVDTIRNALSKHFHYTGRNDFEGFRSNRVYALLAKEPEIFGELVIHPLAMAFAEADLGTSCLLSACLAINLHPGETPQGWHYDDAHISIPLPRPSYGVSAFWAIDDTTAENGATEIIPRSHLWSKDQLPASQAAPSAGPFNYSARDLQGTPMLMPKGSLMITKGTLWHRGGANESDQSRLIITPQYCPGWARQLENMVIATPQALVAKLPRRVRELIGYNIHPPFMGYTDGVHPDKFLEIS